MDFSRARKYLPLPRNIRHSEAREILLQIQRKLENCRVSYYFSGNGEIHNSLTPVGYDEQIDVLHGTISYSDKKRRQIEVGFEFRDEPLFSKFKFNGMRYDECDDDEEVKIHDIVSKSLDDYFKTPPAPREKNAQPSGATRE